MAEKQRYNADLEANIPMAQAVDNHGQATSGQVLQAELDSLDRMERSIRHAFARKVFGLLMMQVLIMISVVCLFIYVEPIRQYLQTGRGSIVVSVLTGLGFVISTITLSCNPSLNRKYPTNIIGLVVIALFAGAFMGTFAVDVAQDYVWICFASTFGIMAVLALFASQTRVDFTGIGPYLSVAIILLIIFSIFGGLSFTIHSDWNSGRRSIVYTAIFFVILSLYVVYDVQLVMGGKHRLRFGVDDYVVATLSLFTDFVLLFSVALGGGQN